MDDIDSIYKTIEAVHRIAENLHDSIDIKKREKYFVDNKNIIKHAMDSLNTIIDEHPDNEEAIKAREMLSDTLNKWKDDFTSLNMDKVYAPVDYDNNAPGKVKETNKASFMNYMAHISGSGDNEKGLFFRADSLDEVHEYLDTLSDTHPGCSISLYEVKFKEIPLSTSTKVVYRIPTRTEDVNG